MGALARTAAFDSRGDPVDTGRMAAPRRETPVRRPGKLGRPRSAAVDAAILRVTFELLPDTGLRGLIMEEVAARAGVSKATLYRRYASKKELVAAALSTIRTAKPAPDTGSVRGDLLALFEREWAAAQRVPNVARLVAKLLGDAGDDAQLFELARRTLVASDRRAITEILRRGLERGELRRETNVVLATDALHGTLVYRILLVDQGASKVPRAYFRDLVDLLLTGIREQR